MSEVFSCPNCTANLEYDGGDHLTVQCPYCGSSVIVPEKLRPQVHRQSFAPLLAQGQHLQRIIALINDEKKIEAIKLYRETYGVGLKEAKEAVERLSVGRRVGTAGVQVNVSTAQPPRRSRAGCTIVMLLLILLVVLGFGFGLPQFGGLAGLQALLTGQEPGANDRSEAQGGDAELPAVIATAISGAAGQDEPEVETASPVATLFVIGERGISPGQFNDARALAIGGDDTIYVADRDSGRLQLFDREGNYQTTWEWDGDSFTDDLEIDREHGVLLAQQSSDIFRYDLADGVLQDQLVYTGEFSVSYSNLALTVQGDILALNRISNSIIQFDRDGNVVRTIPLETVPDAISLGNLTVDGLGNIYAIGVVEDLLGDRQDVIIKYNNEGAYLSQFGNSSSADLFLGTLSAIAVDGQGRIYVADFQGIQVFDGNGRLLHLIELDGVARDMAFNNAGELVAITSQEKLYAFDVSALE